MSYTQKELKKVRREAFGKEESRCRMSKKIHAGREEKISRWM